MGIRGLPSRSDSSRGRPERSAKAPACLGTAGGGWHFTRGSLYLLETSEKYPLPISKRTSLPWNGGGGGISLAGHLSLLAASERYPLPLSKKRTSLSWKSVARPSYQIWGQPLVHPIAHHGDVSPFILTTEPAIPTRCLVKSVDIPERNRVPCAKSGVQRGQLAEQTAWSAPGVTAVIDRIHIQ